MGVKNIEHMKKVYFLGIGGIGMSAVARYLNRSGVSIYGYDRDETILTKQLSAEGMNIHYDCDIKLIPDDIELFIYTPAIPKTNEEWVYLNTLDLPILKRSEALKIILSNKKVIGVAGTHGKTSTSSMLTHLLHSQGFEVSGFIGGILKNYDSNFVFGNSDWAIVEADEYDRSFLRLYPEIAIIQAMDADHLDIYGDKASILDSFKQFTLQVKEGGTVWVKDDISDFWGNQGWIDELIKSNITVKKFGFDNRDCDLNSSEIHKTDGKMHFTMHNDEATWSCELVMPGRHNVYNATAAAAVGLQLGLHPENIQNGLQSFEGIKRRYEILLNRPDLTVIDDYAHHPVEIEAAIEATKAHFPNRKVTVAFQPHLFTRTQDFKEGFAAALDKADRICLLDIYPARELPIEGVTTSVIVALMSNPNVELLSKTELIDRLNKEDLDVLLVLGAGDIDKLLKKILIKLK